MTNSAKYFWENILPPYTLNISYLRKFILKSQNWHSRNESLNDSLLRMMSLSLKATLPLDIRNSASLSSFKQQLDKENTKVLGYYSSGNRLLQIHHTRLRTECSSLNRHLYSKNIIEDPSCICGSEETTRHFFLERTRYNQARTTMINTLSTFCVPSLNVLLFGDNTLKNHYNKLIFQTVQKYTADSKCFLPE